MVNKVDNCGNIVNYPNGEHLTECDDHQCDRVYYKCPGYYCVPWNYVCNNRWDCPGGSDEIRCKNRSCTGQFRCYQSAVCITTESLCDNVADCFYEDDEMFCHPLLPECPDSCVCFLFSLSCKKIQVESAWVERYLPYVYINISNSAILDIASFVAQFNQTTFHQHL